MDKKILIGIIGEKLDIMQEQFAIIKEYEGKIPTIEIDLLMSNIRDLYDLFINLNQENLLIHLPAGVSTPVAAPKPVAVKREEPPPPPPPPSFPPVNEVPEPEIIDEVSESSPGESKPPFQSPRILAFEPVIEPQEEPESFVTPVEPEEENFVPPVQEEPVYEPDPVVPPQPEPAPPPARPPADVHEPKPPRAAYDLFSDGSPGTLADRYRETNERRVADRLSENKVADLRTTIGINDKFLFINELFEGNMRIYEEAVRKLNESPTMAQADLLLLDLKIVYNWDSESPTVKKFVELVRRKF